jgi:hypothetical protein
MPSCTKFAKAKCVFPCEWKTNKGCRTQGMNPDTDFGFEEDNRVWYEKLARNEEKKQRKLNKNKTQNVTNVIAPVRFTIPIIPPVPVPNKYTTRKSPPYPASDYRGLIMKGNDGNPYISIPNKNGVCRWKLHDVNKKKNKNQTLTYFECAQIYTKDCIKYIKNCRKDWIGLTSYQWFENIKLRVQAVDNFKYDIAHTTYDNCAKENNLNVKKINEHDISYFKSELERKLHKALLTVMSATDFIDSNPNIKPLDYATCILHLLATFEDECVELWRIQ